MSVEKYKKNSRKHRKTYVSSVNIEFYQHRLLEENGLNLSAITRDLLDAFLSREYPTRYEKLKESDRLELIELLDQADE